MLNIYKKANKFNISVAIIAAILNACQAFLKISIRQEDSVVNADYIIVVKKRDQASKAISREVLQYIQYITTIYTVS